MSRSRRQRAGGHTNRTKTKSLIPYIGGKYRLVPKIVPIVEHAAKTYGLTACREWFGGGGRIQLNIPPDLFKDERWYNDKELGLAQLMAVVGDPVAVYELQSILLERGVGEDVFLRALEEKGIDDKGVSLVNGAANTFILATQSYAAAMKSFDPSLDWDLDRVDSYYSRVDALESIQEALEGVVVTQGDCLELLEKSKHDEHALVYLDPPYAPETMRTQGHYGDHSWGILEHKVLAYLLEETAMKVILSGYDTLHYRPLEEAGWDKIHLGEVAVSSSGASRVRANEYLWINFDIPEALLNKVSAPEPPIPW